MRHIVFTGPQGSGKSSWAFKLAQILFLDKEFYELLYSETSPSEIIEKFSQGYEAFVIEEVTATGITSCAKYLDGYALSSEEERPMLIFTTQQDCSKLDSSIFRVINCNNYAVSPLVP